MSFMDRAVEGFLVEERRQVVELGDVWRDEFSRYADKLRVGQVCAQVKVCKVNS